MSSRKYTCSKPEYDWLVYGLIGSSKDKCTYHDHIPNQQQKMKEKKKLAVRKKKDGCH